MNLFDAHCHYHDLPAGAWGGIRAELDRIGLAGAVVNGAYPDDWDAVDELCRGDDRFVRSFGVHPWHLDKIDAPGAGDAWFDALRRRLDARPEAWVGEIGIDHARDASERERSERVFLTQLDEAAVRNRPCTVHCVKAHDRLWQLMEKRAVPQRGWLLHGWGGPAHLVSKFTQRGAYFSFSACTLTRKKPKASIVEVPADRLLIETDAPYMPPPDRIPGARRHELVDESGERLNHPANLEAAYGMAAELLGVQADALAQRVADNFKRLAGRSG